MRYLALFTLFFFPLVSIAGSEVRYDSVEIDGGIVTQADVATPCSGDRARYDSVDTPTLSGILLDTTQSCAVSGTATATPNVDINGNLYINGNFYVGW